MIQRIYKWLRDFFVKYLKKYLLKQTYIALFGKVVGGVKGFVVKYVFGMLWDSYLKPFINYLFREVYMAYRKYYADKKTEAFKKAKTDKEIDESFKDLP